MEDLAVVSEEVQLLLHFLRRKNGLARCVARLSSRSQQALCSMLLDLSVCASALLSESLLGMVGIGILFLFLFIDWNQHGSNRFFRTNANDHHRQYYFSSTSNLLGTVQTTPTSAPTSASVLLCFSCSGGRKCGRPSFAAPRRRSRRPWTERSQCSRGPAAPQTPECSRSSPAAKTAPRAPQGRSACRPRDRATSRGACPGSWLRTWGFLVLCPPRSSERLCAPC
mmetsp:Transcript_27493/g.69339  ORF Transcript_27493/g.69339 Transcript_27493/m.69339 type:complete len:225 (-) Transcript_27493:915-1589(-)